MEFREQIKNDLIDYMDYYVHEENLKFDIIDKSNEFNNKNNTKGINYYKVFIPRGYNCYISISKYDIDKMEHITLTSFKIPKKTFYLLVDVENIHIKVKEGRNYAYTIGTINKLLLENDYEFDLRLIKS